MQTGGHDPRRQFLKESRRSHFKGWRMTEDCWGKKKEVISLTILGSQGVQELD